MTDSGDGVYIFGLSEADAQVGRQRERDSAQVTDKPTLRELVGKQLAAETHSALSNAERCTLKSPL